MTSEPALDMVRRVVMDADAFARVGVALGDPTRRRLLLALLESPAYPSDLAASLGLTRGNVSNHLSCLRGCGLVIATSIGRRVRYELTSPQLAQALAALASLVLITSSQASIEMCGPDDSYGVDFPGALEGVTHG